MTAHIEWAWKGTKSATVTSLHVAGKTILVYFNLAVSALIAKPPILIPCQIFRLYGILSFAIIHAKHRKYRKKSN